MRRLVNLVFAVLPLSAQVEPNAGHWKTWVIPSGSSLRLPAPPASDVTATELQWVKDCVNRRDQTTLNGIHYWDAGAPAYRWVQLALQYVPNSNLAGPQQTRSCADSGSLLGCRHRRLGLQTCVQSPASKLLGPICRACRRRTPKPILSV